jgi:hypothetical protein
MERRLVPTWPAGGWWVGRCRSCGAEIIWAVTTEGTRMAVDARPSEAGNVILEPRGRARMVGTHERSTIGVRHTSHFATCPDAVGRRR